MIGWWGRLRLSCVFGSLLAREVYCVLAVCFLPLNFLVAPLPGKLLMACLWLAEGSGVF